MIRTSVTNLFCMALILFSADSVSGQPPVYPEPASALQPAVPGTSGDRPASIVEGHYLPLSSSNVRSLASTMSVDGYRYYAESAGSNLHPRPEMILSAELSETQQTEITEDLMVLHSLIVKHGRASAQTSAVSVEGYPVTVENTPGFEGQFDVSSMRTAALGINLSRRSVPPIRIQYVQGFGAILTYGVSIPLRRPEPPTTAEETSVEKKETEWESARRQLFSPPVVQRDATASFAAVSTHLKYNENRVKELIDAVSKALENANNVRFPDQNQQIIVLLKGVDDATISLSNRTVSTDAGGSESGRTTTVFEYPSASETLPSSVKATRPSAATRPAGR
ncbi:MAG: hypothetical protein JNL58_28150 [Planctomyces sp.]|nr:hypothetical protein [Planctomyces sp.]